LRTNIQYTSVDRPICTLLVTSPTPEDGKSTIATNLAVILAQGGRKTVILDADLHKPMIHKLMKLPNRKGVSDLFVVPQLSLDGNLQETSVAGLRALTSGSLPPNPAELLGSGKMIEIMNRVKEQVDIVVLDSPPLLAVTDAAVLAPRVDGVLLVIKPGVTKLAACRQAVEQLQQVGANILGVILNDVDMKRSRYRYANYYKGYYSYYHHYYSDDGDGSTRPERKKKK
jgi:non-specific protein-tyrosine kinase